jgi:hypothetical protein
LHEIDQQKSIFSPECDRIEQSRINVHAGSSNGESGRVQVSDATVRLEHVLLKISEPEFFGSANQVRAIPNQVELKTVVLRRVGDRGTKGGKAVRLEPAIAVDEKQHRAFRNLNSVIPGGGNARVRLSDEG